MYCIWGNTIMFKLNPRKTSSYIEECHLKSTCNMTRTAHCICPSMLYSI